MKRLVFFCYFILIITSCNKEQNFYDKDVVLQNIIGDLDSTNMESLIYKKVFFGHQSVGKNILDGLDELLKEHDYTYWPIKQTRNVKDIVSPVFAHDFIGENTDPVSKINDFHTLVDEGFKDNLDIAFFKFCYVDINYKSDIDKILDYYLSKMEDIEIKYAETQFIYCTVPLKAEKKDFKAFVKKILDRNDNKYRNLFNTKLKSRLKNKPIFDLAGIESTYPDGGREETAYGYALVPAYTYDGGHLNASGRKIIAKKMLDFLSAF